MGLSPNSSCLFRSYMVSSLLQCKHVCLHVHGIAVLMCVWMRVFGMNIVFSTSFRVSLPWRNCQGPRQGVKCSVGYLGCGSSWGYCWHYIGQQRSLYDIDISKHIYKHKYKCQCAHDMLVHT